MSFAVALADWSASPRARHLSALDQRLCEESYGARTYHLEPIRVDHVEAELGVGDGVGKRAAKEGHRGAEARRDAELDDEASFACVLHRLAVEAERVIEPIRGGERPDREEEAGIEVLPHQRAAGQGLFSQLDGLGLRGPGARRLGCEVGEDDVLTCREARDCGP